MFTRYFDRYWWVLSLSILAVCFLISGNIVRSAQSSTRSYVSNSCEGADASNFKCWKQHYETLVIAESPEAALKSADAESKKGEYVRTNCHQIAHVIGRQSAKKFDLDVAKTFEKGNQFCASGYYHGAMEAIVANVGPEKIRAEISDICKPLRDKNAYNLAHYDCVHGLGHGVMGMENYELFKALEDCEIIEDNWEVVSCGTGVFMENIMSVVNNPDYPTKYLKKDDPMYPCYAVSDTFKSSCYLNQTSYALTAVGGSYEKVFEICSQADDHAATCYQSLGRDASGNTIQNPQAANDICQKGINYEQKSNCVIGAVKDIVWIGNSKLAGDQFCVLQKDAQIASVCRNTAESYYASFN